MERDLEVRVLLLCPLRSHVNNIETTDQLVASEMLFNEGCHVLDLAVVIAALVVDAVVLDPCLSFLAS